MPPQTPVIGTQTIHPNNDLQSTVPQITYSVEAQKYINFRRMRMIAARDVRDAPNEYWDDMPFLRWYDLMLKADNQYVAPRKNKTDTSLNTGTIRDKDTSLVEYAAKYDFEPVAQVFDDSDDMLEDLAETGEDLVRKSFLLEDMKAKAKLIYRSMVAFGTALVEDQYVESWKFEKQLTPTSRIGSENAVWTERLVKAYDGCQSKLWDLRKIYFGDIRKFFLNGPQGQPFMFTVEYESYDVTKQIFGDWDRWMYVPTYVQSTTEAAGITTYQASWTLRPISQNYCEIIRYYDPIANEFALTINGVDMLPILERKVTIAGTEKTIISGFPLTEISPSGAIPFAKYDLEPMHDFAYSKAQPAKMRVMGDVENMWLKAMIRIMKQRSDPTMGNKSGRNFDSSVTFPGNIINDIRDGDLFPVLPNFQGTTPADMSFYELIKKELDKNSVERDFQGINSDNQIQETATGDMNDMKAQSLKVAALFDGIIFGNNQLYWLRTYNIAKNWTKPIDVRIDQLTNGLQMKYRTVTMPTQIDGGQKATKKIVFTKTPPTGSTELERSQTVHQEELDYGKTSGDESRFAYLHPELFATVKLKWFYSCIPVPNGSDPLAYMMFAKQVNDAIAMFGPESLNVKKLKHKFAAVTGNDFDTWFINDQELQQKQQQAAQAAAPQQTTPGMNPQQPTMAGAIQGAPPAQRMGAVM